jgi:hypothetical protein
MEHVLVLKWGSRETLRFMKGLLLLLDDIFLLLHSHLQLVILTRELLKHGIDIKDFIDSHLIDQFGTSLSESSS